MFSLEEDKNTITATDSIIISLHLFKFTDVDIYYLKKITVKKKE